jgi:hypothetical protein
MFNVGDRVRCIRPGGCGPDFQTFLKGYPNASFLVCSIGRDTMTLECEDGYTTCGTWTPSYFELVCAAPTTENISWPCPEPEIAGWSTDIGTGYQWTTRTSDPIARGTTLTSIDYEQLIQELNI